jgi:DNA-binding transcriptional MerR regulator
MARPIDPNSEASEAARLTEQMGFRVTRKMVTLWRRKNYPLANIRELRRVLKNQERQPPGLNDEPVAESRAEPPEEKQSLSAEDVEQELANLQRNLLGCNNYEDARTINTKITGVRNVLKELREQRHYIRIAEAIQDAARAAIASKSAWEGIEDELPPRLEGLSAAQMKKELRAYGQLKARELAEVFGAMI